MFQNIARNVWKGELNRHTSKILRRMAPHPGHYRLAQD